MSQEAAPAQETRDQTVGVRVTQTEKDAIDMVVKVRRPDGGVGGLLRERTLQDVIDEGRKFLDRLAEEVA